MVTRSREEILDATRIVRDYFNPRPGYTLAGVWLFGDGSYGASYVTDRGSGYGGQGATPLLAMESAIADIEWFETRHERVAS